MGHRSADEGMELGVDGGAEEGAERGAADGGWAAAMSRFQDVLQTVAPSTLGSQGNAFALSLIRGTGPRDEAVLA